MMTDEQAEALGLRLVACEWFRLMPGMRVRAGLGEWRDWHRITEGTANLPVIPHGGDIWPDVRDPATLGCVLALVREKHGPLASVAPYAGIAPDVSTAARWRVRDGRGRDLIPWQRCVSEAEAIVAAMETAG